MRACWLSDIIKVAFCNCESPPQQYPESHRVQSIIHTYNIKTKTHEISTYVTAYLVGKRFTLGLSKMPGKTLGKMLSQRLQNGNGWAAGKR